ncbi:valine--tRNA ligase [Candidatus Kuenenbacteria bacterium HGW-Kuenenbacteria-1]|uniref:Valine--tRNA ligase n=1 Tax=Candidatus Kuenenbacteria bacterium HGW-Kuenenbacteria-1 TaxID=2013812 RepID=A0A2N1UPE8_9BACT|nr:MAG: valine--tRNA ligase [Candidatus Kuenenbacteria bacterium HGW-Kuenenbacteria-1]
MNKTYEPQNYEDKIYQKWENSGYFNPDKCVKDGIADKNAPTYTIILPPPNITAKLHLGHSAMLAIEDLMIRYHRMKGDQTLWLPGTDHAAIATQNAVEKKIFKEQGLTRHDLGREKLLEEIWIFLKETQSTILKQMRKMGASLDWSREAFTFDKQREKAVTKMFVDMYEAGVIYKGERIVNWCPRCHSTLADDEVEYKEQKTKLYFFKYSKDFPFTIATTRPETKLGDTAVAVNPKDDRYKKYIGKIYEIDFLGVILKLKIIADYNVEMEFGTGALGVTPAHSAVDWQMAEKNNLEIIKVIDENGKIRQGFNEFSNKNVLEAREMIVEKLKQQNLLEKEEEINNNLSICYRCNTPIEPLPSKQWFVNVNKKLERLGNKSLKEKAIEVAKNKEIKFIPERFEKRYLDWMENLHDWCISRQIWFGHQIPVWYKSKFKDNDEIYVGIEKPKEDNWTQDPDTLDTWFSSGMWTFSTLGWPDTFKKNKKSGDLAKFHSTQVLETGYEILTLWVSRMIMMSLFAIQEIPFENVYLHGMILDKNGKKMSKSKGNGIDPIDMIEKFGADAVRLSMLIGNTPGNDARLSEEKIEGFRNFINKLWNISRFIISQKSIKLKVEKLEIKIEKECLTLADVWILNKFNNLIKKVDDDLNNYNFSQAGEKLKEFTWNDFADWYLEISKFEKNEEKNEILFYILENLLKLWHPFIPFITEVIWQELSERKFLMIEKWPTQFVVKKNNIGNDFEIIKNIIIAIRNVRSENKIEPSQKIKVIIYANKKIELIKNQIHLIKSLRTNINEIEVKDKGEKISQAIYISVDEIEIYLLAEIDVEKEKARKEKEINNLEKIIKTVKNKLSNQEFIKKAPKQIIKQEKEKLELWQTELKNLKFL